MNKKFNFQCLFIKLSSRKLWVWLLSSFFIYKILLQNHDKSYFIHMVVGQIIISVIYLIGTPIEKAISAAIEKANINLQLNNNLNTNINANATANIGDK